MNDESNLFGKPVFSYSRAEAMEDGLLIDVSSMTDAMGRIICREYGFRISVALTRSAWEAAIETGGKWVPADDGQGEEYKIAGGQTMMGRLRDLLWLFQQASKSRHLGEDRIYFKVDVDAKGNGTRQTVKLWALCGPGDNAEPVLTIMLEGED